MIAKVEKKAMRGFATIAFKKFGKAVDVLESTPSLAAVSPLNGQVSVKISANQISSEDLRAICGISLLRKSTGIAGSTGVGHITSIGGEVSNVGTNDKVLVVSTGVWADNVTVPVSSVLKIPSNLSPEDGANLPAALSAYAILHNFTTLKAGDIVVQSGGESALGKAISQIATASGLTVVSPTNAELEDAEYAKKIATKGTVKLCITNNSKKSVTKMLLRCLAPEGVMVLYNGEVENQDVDGIDVPVGSVIFRGNSIEGFDFNVWMNSSPKEVQKAMTAVAAHLDNKKITLKSKVYPQSEYLKAMDEAKISGGSVVLKL
mmetsp:Transcript_6035/g.6173  ORF Transcript_6035/g.6173 Transcript_6035/m.6173 type:complete len:319 (-) Transcript_6035:124-1080(-)|eukprot:CAMPEP_0119042710 /NCGR_PEP_ID=MMETSP1177-20130426/16102_1 /TAXON_ID=2985 /ORGANISM="Ochromonas sp, Strain CCMP1899" /LENGTH=318 /DNA_ID=CAMNT_0007009689 /DNA_START=62 /DNA_END=1018 /DNA_ORIENTATION=+